MLYGPHHKLKLSQERIEAVCLSASREFYDNASSGNYKMGDMRLAYEWYATLKSTFYLPSLNCNLVWRFRDPLQKLHRRRNLSKLPHG